MYARSKKGFTLVEILIVVVILGILAATVLPQFTSATEDAKASALKQNLQQLRVQIDLYRFQHNNTLPGPTATNFADQLTKATKIDGTTAAVGTAGYPVGLTIAPIMPLEDWRARDGELLDGVAGALDGTGADLTVECITHRFTPGSKETLLDWYPRTRLEMDESRRTTKRGRFGSVKHVYPKETMTELRGWFQRELAERLPQGRLLYWT